MKNENLRTLSIVNLKKGLLEMLQAKSYSEGTLNNYRRTLTILESYMYDNRIDTYTPVVGSVFITDYFSGHNLGISRQKSISTMVNRLNNYYNGTDYALQRKRKIALITGNYEDLLESYLSYCIKNGNKDGTIISKRLFCSRFLKHLSDFGCHELK